MKNIQVIDGALNCTYDVFGCSEEDFRAIFPAEGQDVEFIEDFIDRAGEDAAGAICERLWRQKMPKVSVDGIHGTLFYELAYKRRFYPTKRESEMVAAID